jgi:hypothetical protein
MVRCERRATICEKECGMGQRVKWVESKLVVVLVVVVLLLLLLMAQMEKTWIL